MDDDSVDQINLNEWMPIKPYYRKTRRTSFWEDNIGTFVIVSLMISAFFLIGLSNLAQ